MLSADHSAELGLLILSSGYGSKHPVLLLVTTSAAQPLCTECTASAQPTRCILEVLLVATQVALDRNLTEKSRRRAGRLTQPATLELYRPFESNTRVWYCQASSLMCGPTTAVPQRAYALQAACLGRTCNWHDAIPWTVSKILYTLCGQSLLVGVGSDPRPEAASEAGGVPPIEQRRLYDNALTSAAWVHW